MNNISLMGRLTRDVELKVIDNGTSISKFSVAVNRDFKNKDGEYEADFFNCVAFKHTADFVKTYFKKGQMIGLTGRVQIRKWDKDGENRYTTEIIVSNVSFAGEKRNPEQAQSNEDTEATIEEAATNDDLPF